MGLKMTFYELGRGYLDLLIGSEQHRYSIREYGQNLGGSVKGNGEATPSIITLPAGIAIRSDFCTQSFALASAVK